MKCPHCGYDKIQPTFNFCPKCKNSLKEQSQTKGVVEHNDDQTQEKGFINRAFSRWTYERAMADPYAYASWAYRNPNDNRAFLERWNREGNDLSIIRQAISEANRARYENPTTDRAEVDANIIDSTQRSSRRESNSTFVNEVNSNYTTNAASVVRNKAIWKLQPGELARHIAPDEWCYVSEHLEGLVIEEGTSAIIYVDGQEVAQMGSGMYVFDDKHAAAAEMEAERRRHEHQSSGGFFSRLASGIYRFFTGHKREEGSMQREERRRRVQQIISRLKKDTIIDVYLKSDRVFPAIFGSQYTGPMPHHDDIPQGYQPYNIQSRYLDLQVGVSMQMRISDFKQFIANYMAGRKSVSIADVVTSVDSAVFSILRYRLRDVEVSERGLDEVTFNMIAGHLRTNLPNLLHGVDVVAVLDITTENEQLKRFREVEAQLYCSEQEYDFLLRTNEFRNRIASEENDQKIREAQSEQDLRVRLDEINKDKLIHDDEMEQFVSLLMNQKVIREATNKADLDKAMLEIERNRLVSQDEFDIFTNDLEYRRFDRDQVSEQLRARSLTATVLNQMELNKKIDLREIEDNKEIRIAGLYAEDKISDVEWNIHRKERGRDAEDWDLEAAVYGRKYVLDRQKLIDNAEKRRLQNEVEAEAIKGDRQGKDYIRENILKDHTLYEGIKDDDYRRKIREREDDYQHKLREKEDKIKQIQSLIELEQNTKDREMHRNLEAQRVAVELELAQIKEQHEHDLNWLKEKNQTDIAKETIKADVDKTRIEAEKNMSADQLMSKNIGEMDADAQVKFAESFSHLNDVKLAEANAAQTKELYEKMLHMAEENNIRMDKINTNNTDVMKDIMMKVLESFTKMNVAQSGGQQSTVNSMLGAMQNFANTRFNDAKDMKEEYRGQMQHEQGRTDETQRQALNYTTHVKVSENTPNIVRGTSVNVHVNSHTCPSCGQPIEDNDISCCPICGRDL